MYSIDERHAGAVGIRNDRLGEVEDLCKMLSENPLNHLQALRQVSRILLPFQP
jgi:hypothetical protein